MIPANPGPAKSEPTVAVVLATNRGGRYLGEALDSVGAQTYPCWEVVVVDDGSPEPAAIDRVARGRRGVRVLHQRNAGVSVARNVGVAASGGALVTFLDDDDLWDPDRLTRQTAALGQDPEAVASYGKVRSIDADGRTLAAPGQEGARDLHDIFSRRVTPQFQSLMVRRSALLRVGGFHPALRLAEDLDLVLRLAGEGAMVFVPAELGSYRTHEANVTRDQHELARSIEQVLLLHRHMARHRRPDLVRDLDEALRRNRLFGAWVAYTAMRRAARQRRFVSALAELTWGVNFSPDAPLTFLRNRLSRQEST